MTEAEIAQRRIETLTEAEMYERRDALRAQLEERGLSAVQTAELHLLEEACGMKPLRESEAYERGRADAEAGKPKVTPDEFATARASDMRVPTTRLIYAYYERGYDAYIAQASA